MNKDNIKYLTEKHSGEDIFSDLVRQWIKKHQLKKTQAKDFTESIDGKRYRVHLFHAYNGWNAALRLLPTYIMSFTKLKIDSKEVLSICNKTGLVLFCGATATGKSTTMNTVVNSLFESKDLGVAVSIEDPIEYLYNKEGIYQREIGIDVSSFAAGLTEAVRITPRTIIIGEIRDTETALEAVRAGLNGHRVLATLHASSIKEAIARLWGFLDDQGDELLIFSLQGVMAQHLIYYREKIYCVYETLLIDEKVKTTLKFILSKSGNLNLLTQQQYEQKRLSLVEKKEKLIKEGMNPEVLKSI